MAVERAETTYSIGVKYHVGATDKLKTKTINYINMPPRDEQTAGTLDPYYNLMTAINTSIIGGVGPTVQAGETSQLTEE